MTTHVKIGAEAPRKEYTANGTQTAFPFDFAVFAAADIEVRVNGAVVASGFSVAVGADGRGTVTFALAPAAGARVTLLRRLTIQRQTDFQEGGELRAKTLNDELDFQTAAVQQVAHDASRAVRLPDADAAGLDMRLPIAATRANKLLAFDAAGLPIASAQSLAAVEAGPNAAAAAQSSATAAATSATNAATSATAAAASAAAIALPLAIGQGGTGATSAAAARAALGAEDAALNHAYLDAVQAFTQAQRYVPATLSDAAGIDWNLDTQTLARVTLAGNRTMNAPSNQRDGGSYALIVQQDATGGRSLAWNAAFDFGTDGVPSLPSGANKVAIFTFLNSGSLMRCVGRWSN
ncbi:MAG: phage tail fiber protein [Tagaea sp.]